MLGRDTEFETNGFDISVAVCAGRMEIIWVMRAEPFPFFSKRVTLTSVGLPPCPPHFCNPLQSITCCSDNGTTGFEVFSAVYASNAAMAVNM